MAGLTKADAVRIMKQRFKLIRAGLANEMYNSNSKFTKALAAEYKKEADRLNKENAADIKEYKRLRDKLYKQAKNNPAVRENTRYKGTDDDFFHPGHAAAVGHEALREFDGFALEMEEKLLLSYAEDKDSAKAFLDTLPTAEAYIEQAAKKSARERAS